MTDQLDWLRRVAPPRQEHSETSVDAAQAIRPVAGTLRYEVYNCLCVHGPQTDEEIHDRLGGNPGTYRARRIELWRAGLVRDTGITRPTRSGRQATVWGVAP
jgi:hypothetical protein